MFVDKVGRALSHGRPKTIHNLMLLWPIHNDPRIDVPSSIRRGSNAAKVLHGVIGRDGVPLVPAGAGAPEVPGGGGGGAVAVGWQGGLDDIGNDYFDYALIKSFGSVWYLV